MAYEAIKREWNAYVEEYQYEYICDTEADVANLPKCATGSTAMVREGGKLYMVGADGEWGIFG
jgi:hypothetical protein